MSFSRPQKQEIKGGGVEGGAAGGVEGGRNLHTYTHIHTYTHTYTHIHCVCVSIVLVVQFPPSTLLPTANTRTHSGVGRGRCGATGPTAGHQYHLFSRTAHLSMPCRYSRHVTGLCIFICPKIDLACTDCSLPEDTKRLQGL